MPSKKQSPKKTAVKSAALISAALVPETLAPLVIRLRRENVILDSDIAEIYGVETKRLNEAIKRNIERFPKDFMFQLTEEEYENLRSQIATSKTRGGRTYLPYAFTEQGVAMLSSVLRSQRAVEVNIAIMRTFVQLRSLMQSNKLLAEKIEALEKKYDQNFHIVFDAIKQLIAADQKPSKELGFHTIPQNTAH